MSDVVWTRFRKSPDAEWTKVMIENVDEDKAIAILERASAAFGTPLSGYEEAQRAHRFGVMMHARRAGKTA